jgi:Xaa-Pro aminopeptidase
MSKKETKLIVAASETDANLLYATRFFAPDTFIFFQIGGKKFVVMNDLEIDRAKKSADVHRVLSYTRYQNLLKREGARQPRLSDVLARVLREFRVRNVVVPSNFPVMLAERLRKNRIKLRAQPEPFFLEREVKTPDEVRKIEMALRLAEEGMRAAESALRAARIGRDGFLYWRKQKLRAGDVRGMINSIIAGLGGNASRTIVACGNQACDPHEEGHGPLRAHVPIIVDIFPRDSTGYWGDITRTFVRGRASDFVKKLYATVLDAQKIVFDSLRDGANGREIHDSVVQFFAKNGYKTGKIRGRMAGFFHGTGHGLGLDIHELPRIGAVKSVLRAGNVVTVEPALYYWGRGAVRLEDVAVVGEKSARNLTRYPKILEI